MYTLIKLELCSLADTNRGLRFIAGLHYTYFKKYKRKFQFLWRLIVFFFLSKGFRGINQLVLCSIFARQYLFCPSPINPRALCLFYECGEAKAGAKGSLARYKEIYFSNPCKRTVTFGQYLFKMIFGKVTQRYIKTQLLFYSLSKHASLKIVRPTLIVFDVKR